MKPRMLIMGLSAIETLNRAMSQRMKADIPSSITTPDSVKTRIGNLNFFDGLPDHDTVRKVYDNLDFSRGVEAFMAGMPAASVRALSAGFTKAGFAPNKAIGITEELADARTLFLTPNATVVYVWFCVDLMEGPMVVQVPPGVLGMINDAYFRYVADLGLTGIDQGKGGKYLLIPPGYTGPIPKEGYFIYQPRTYSNLFILRSFVIGGNVSDAVQIVRRHARMYPLALADNPPNQKFVDISGQRFNTVHANDLSFYKELNEVVQHEPADFVEPETVGLFASIGIKKGRSFSPDARMKAILTDAVAVGNATARAIVFASRDDQTKFFHDRQWRTGFIGGSYEFLSHGERMLDARTLFHYYATGITPAMAAANPGSGSAYAYTACDSEGNYFDGSKTYKVTLPAPIPAGQFWSITIYDNQTRSMLETNQRAAGVDSNQANLKKNADGSVTIWFAPKAPKGQKSNWVQTTPGKGWNTILRLYAPLQAWFDKSWKPGDIELVE